MKGMRKISNGQLYEAIIVFGVSNRRLKRVAETSTVLSLLSVTDTNDNPPTFLESVYSFDVGEDWVRGSRVGAVEAADPDEGENGLLSYSVISDWANDVFSLNPQTGVFTLTTRLDYEEQLIPRTKSKRLLLKCGLTTWESICLYNPKLGHLNELDVTGRGERTLALPTTSYLLFVLERRSRLEGTVAGVEQLGFHYSC
ncbi:unnamed protein product [Nezara viridula]|uniref:Cadherin domain-containing protein n=1 Tax=Nezara viridula TaxID=85310 RepID=A0A9P0H7H5_NEZVI|nr:unnamed protein product [Nezara viridula]